MSTKGPEIPYLFLIMPLTLLSDYLILWKPRKRESPGTQLMSDAGLNRHPD
jgi:hypothetical protein